MAAGLWIHHWYVSVSARDAAREAAWEGLAEWAEEAARSIESLDPASLAAESDAARRALDTAFRIGAGEGRFFLVDQRWRVKASSGPSSDEALSAGASVTWTPAASQVAGAHPLRGHFELADGTHLAVAYALSDGRGYVVAHRPLGPLEMQAQNLLAALPAASALTLLWTMSLLAITVYLIVTRFYDSVAREREQADAAAVRRTESLVRTWDAVVFGLAKLADSRDPETGDHLDRLSHYATILAAALRRFPRYADVVTPGFVRLIGISSALHDVGKVGIEDAVLLKPGPLTDRERKRMQEHVMIGAQCLWEIAQRLGSSNFLEMAHQIAQSHHEKWDGTGYPQGLAGERIPLAARIVSIADVYDACSTKRVYKDAFSHERCVEIIREGSGTQFDPSLVEVWLTIEPRFAEIARQYHGARPPETRPQNDPPPEPIVADHDEPVLAGTASE